MLVKLINRRKWLLVVVILYAMLPPQGMVYAQESYRTYLGTIVLSTEVNNKPFQFISNELDVLLNYETAEFKFSLKKYSIRANSISNLQLYKPDEITFSGKLGIDFIKTDSHPVQIFDVEGVLSSAAGQEVAVHASGRLSHLYTDTNIACLLDITMQLDKQDIKGFILDGSPSGDMQINITNTILDEN